MKRGMALLILLASFGINAETNVPLTLALNEPDQLLAQRQAAVMRLEKLLEQKKSGIKPVAEMPKVTHVTTSIQKRQPVKKLKVAKIVKSKKAQAAEIEPVKNKKLNVAVVAWGGELIDGHHFERLMSDQRMAGYMVRTISESLDKALNTKNNYTNVMSSEWTSSIIYEGDNNSQSKRACSQYQVEKLVVVAFSRYATSGAAEVILFDCKNGQKKADTFDLDTTVNERYYMEKDFSAVLKKFYKGNIRFLSS